MNNEELILWRMNCKKEVVAQLILNKLRKENKIENNKEKEIQKKINLLGYSNFLRSPHLEGKEDLKKRAQKICLNDYLSSISFTE